MSSSSGQSRDFDVVLFGATGFAGRLTARYLAEHAPADCRWAIAGRDPAKLTAVAVDTGAPDLPVVAADVTDAASLDRLAARTRVLITTVGPYVTYGDAAVGACARAGTDYLDLTGEPEFVDRSFVAHDAEARRTGARLVHSAGFDSVPYDLGALFTVEQLPADSPIEVDAYVRVSAEFSGGTFLSLLTALTRPRQNLAAARARRAAETRSPSTRRVRAVLGRPHPDPTQHGWALPMPSLDPQVVTRTAWRDDRFGPDFRYSQFASFPHLRTAAGVLGGLPLLAGAVQLPPVRDLILRRVVAPGDGPSAEKRARSWFTVTFDARGGGEQVRTRVSGGDPGYDETAKILAESALCLAFDELPTTSGQVTTGTAMGDALIGRLRAAGIGFEVLPD